MIMQQRHFELIAATIKDMDEFVDGDNYGHDVREHVAREFASRLRTANPQFNTDRFLRACGVE